MSGRKTLNQLPPAELHKLSQVGKELAIPSGQQIFKEGDPGDGLYLVIRGRVQISVLLESGERQLFYEAQPGEIFGEMAVLDKQPRSASASAVGDTTVCFVPGKALTDLLRSSPELSSVLLAETCRRLRDFNSRYIDKVLQSERMALVGRFASAIIHDLKNPLAILNMIAESACAENATAEMREQAKARIQHQVHRINGLVNDILDFTRDAPAVDSAQPVDYSRFVADILQELEPELAMRKVVLVQQNEPPRVVLPLKRARLSRVFYNLAGNAADAMPDGGTLTIRFLLTDSAVVTEIEDTGKGIPEEIASRLFEPFATYGKQRGTGLGLSICQRIIHEHEGKIWARNQPDGGAVFAFSLPRPG